jgi:hypothetical protein
MQPILMRIISRMLRCNAADGDIGAEQDENSGGKLNQVQCASAASHLQ